jgi:hypothetical protein
MKRGDSIYDQRAYIHHRGGPGAVCWIRKDSVERSLIIVDEASMVDEAIWNDLLSFNIPMAVGDHGQLPPVGSAST